MTKSNENAPDLQPRLAAAPPPGEPVAGSDGHPESIPPCALLAQVLERANLQRALKRVRQNKGAPGIDGMTVEELPEYLKHRWLDIRAQLETCLLYTSVKPRRRCGSPGRASGHSFH